MHGGNEAARSGRDRSPEHAGTAAPRSWLGLPPGAAWLSVLVQKHRLPRLTKEQVAAGAERFSRF